jgi:hypothetical protein
MKTCAECHTPKPLEAFKRHAASPDGRTYICKDCLRGRRESLAHLTPEERRQRQSDIFKKRYASDPEFRDRLRGHRRKSVYGVSPEVVQVLLDRQGGTCAICLCSPKDATGQGGFHLDHDHDTGQIRGLLCFMCNRGLGDFFDDPVRLRSAVRYLTASREPLVVKPGSPKVRAQCGTISGYIRHRRQGEEKCDACRAAWSMYNSNKNWERRKAPEDLKHRKVAECGTSSGYTAHYNRKEPPCDACRAARAVYQATRKQQKKQPPPTPSVP